MSDLLPPAVASALNQMEMELADPSLQPRDEEELIDRLETLIGAASVVSPTSVYVPNAEAPTTPDEKDAQIAGPLALLEPQARGMSTRAKNLISGLLGLVAETNSVQSGLAATLTTAAAAIANAKSLVGNSSLQWMSATDRFLDLAHIDPSLSTSITVDTTTGNGVSLAPTSEQDLTSTISTLTLVQSRSGSGLPGDNLELSALQATPGATTPAAGASTALASAKETVASSGGTGQEPTVSYAGNPDLHADLSAITSGQSTTWFDWEKVYVPPIQKCSKLGTAYVADPTSGSDVDVISVTHNYGWNATVQNADGTTRSAKLAVFSSQPPIPGRDGPTSTLTLAIEIDMGQAVPLNQLGVAVLQAGGLWPNITSVDVSLDHSQWQPMRCQGGSLTWSGSDAATAASTAVVDSGGVSATATGDNLRGSSLWEIPSYSSVDPAVGLPQFRYVAITFAQPDSYACPKGIGHPYYVEVVQTNKSGKALFGLISNHSQSTTTTRQPSPDKVVGVTAGTTTTTTKNNGGSLGAALGAAANLLPVSMVGKAAVSDTKALGGIGSAVSTLVTGLLGSSSKTTNVLQAGEYNDVFQAYRQCISVAQVQPLSRTYSTDTPGQLVSGPITFGHPFTAVRLFVDQRQGSGTSVTYDVSVDEGQTWLPITPLDLGQPPAPSITAGSLTAVDLQGTYTSVRYRATLSTTQAHTAPRLLGVCLEALPA